MYFIQDDDDDDVDGNIDVHEVFCVHLTLVINRNQI